jgi:hypothetical protein
MGPQSRGNPNSGNFETLIWESWDKLSFDVAPVEKRKVYYKGEGGGFPQVQAVMSLVNPRLHVALPNTKSVQTMH